MKRKRIGAVTAGLFCLAAAHAGSSWADVEFSGMEVGEFWTEARISKAPDVPRMILAGFVVVGKDPQAGRPSEEVELAAINAEQFLMRTKQRIEKTKAVVEERIKHQSAMQKDRTVYALSGVGRLCAVSIAKDFFDEGVRAVRIALSSLMPTTDSHVANDSLGRRCNFGQNPNWTVAAGRHSEDLPLNFGWEKQLIGKVNRADLPGVIARDGIQAVEILNEEDGMYTVFKLERLTK